MSSLTSDQVALQLDDLDGWDLDGNSIGKTFVFSDFASAIAFITKSAFHCVELEHYPNWSNHQNIVAVKIGESDQSAVRGRDIQLAKRIEGCYTA